MSGFLGKIGLIVLVAVAVWVIFRAAIRPAAGRPPARRTRADASAPRGEAVEDMRPCPTCGTYVPARGGQACGKPACPLLPKV